MCLFTVARSTTVLVTSTVNGNWACQWEGANFDPMELTPVKLITLVTPTTVPNLVLNPSTGSFCMYG